jgi:cytochrome c oxidase subunit IV
VPSTHEPHSSRLRQFVASLGGHIAVFEVVWALPFALFFLHQSYAQGSLTLAWALRMVFLTASGGLAVGTFMWYVVTRPRIRQRSNNRWRGP